MSLIVFAFNKLDSVTSNFYFAFYIQNQKIKGPGLQKGPIFLLAIVPLGLGIASWISWVLMVVLSQTPFTLFTCMVEPGGIVAVAVKLYVSSVGKFDFTVQSYPEAPLAILPICVAMASAIDTTQF